MAIPLSTLSREPLEPILTNDEVLEFFTTHLHKGGCPLCLHDRFTLIRLSEDQSIYLALPAFELQPGKPIGPSARHIPLISVVCDNCSSVYSLLRTAVEAWADTKRAERNRQS